MHINHGGLDLKTMLDTTEIQERLADEGLRVSKYTLFRWRKTKRGPRWVDVEGFIRYPVADFESWLAEKMEAAAKSGAADCREASTPE